MVVTLGLAVVAASPALSVFVPFQGGSERFSEIWLLDPRHMVEDYPSNVTFGEMYSVFVRVGNHMGSSEYYMVYVKFRNRTQSLPDVSGSLPSSLPPLYEFRFFATHGETWESPVIFAFQDVSFQNDSISVGEISINGMDFSVDAHADWDSENSMFCFELFFELWNYDEALQDFRFQDRFVGIWLNMTV